MSQGPQQPVKTFTARQKQAQRDVQKWEDLRLAGAGLVTNYELDDIASEKNESHVNLLIHDIKPPFLSGKNISTDTSEKSYGLVSVVRDPTSDLAILARNGSAVLRSFRESRDRERHKDKFWEASGNRIGNVMGLSKDESKSKEEKEQELQDELQDEQINSSVKNDDGLTIGIDSDNEQYLDGSVDYKTRQSYAKSMKKQSDKVSSFAMSKSIMEQRTFLPVYTVRSQLLQCIRENQVIVVVGETGSGKTTQLTQYLLEDGFGAFGMIGCTQPRRLAAVSVARRVAEEQGVELGGRVGYSIRFDDCTSEETIIKYMTDGMLLRESLTSSDLDRYSVIIMDEAHERSLNTDVLFGILKNICSKRSDLKLIVTSATLDANRFSRFFGNAPVFQIPGRTFPVDIIHRTSPSDDYVRDAVDQALAIHISQGPGDILVFMTGQDDIEAVCSLLRRRIDELDQETADTRIVLDASLQNTSLETSSELVSSVKRSSTTPPIVILPIYSQLASEQHALIFDAVPGARKCVVATNIAETSLTIDGIRYVVDCGFSKLKVYSPKIGMDALQITPISQASAGQRAGRAGRTGPGQCYRLYTEHQYLYEMLSSTVPEIQRTNLANVVLLLKSLGVDDLLKFDFMDSPPEETILSSLYSLWVLGALNNAGKLTDIGQKMTDFPLDPPLAKIVISGEKMGCANEALTIAAMLCEPEIFAKPKDRLEEANRMREKFQVSESDHLTLLNIYQQWRNNKFSTAWCRRHFLQPKKLMRVREVRSQMLDIMKSHKMNVSSCGYDWDIVRKAVCSAYFSNAARFKGSEQYSNMRTGLTCHLHPSSALFGSGTTPDYVVYHELVLTTKEYMRCVSIVEPEWLAELGPMFFSIRETHRQMLERKTAEMTKLKERAAELQISVEELIRRDEEVKKSHQSQLSIEEDAAQTIRSIKEKAKLQEEEELDTLLQLSTRMAVVGEGDKKSRLEARKKRRIGF